METIANVRDEHSTMIVSKVALIALFAIVHNCDYTCVSGARLDLNVYAININHAASSAKRPLALNDSLDGNAIFYILHLISATIVAPLTPNSKV